MRKDGLMEDLGKCDVCDERFNEYDLPLFAGDFIIEVTHAWGAGFVHYDCMTDDMEEVKE